MKMRNNFGVLLLVLCIIRACQGAPYNDLRMASISRTEIVIEVIPNPNIGNLKIWSVKDSSGRTVCFIEASSPLKECSHHFSATDHIRVNYKIAGEWPEGSTDLFDSYGYNNEYNRFNTLPVQSAGETSIEVGFTPDPRIGRYELWATSKKTGKYAVWCDRNRGRCQINNMRPAVNYTLTLASCYGSQPIHCMVQAKQQTVNTKPKSPAPLSTTASALGSLTIQFTPGPEPNDVDYYEANIGQLKCSVKASVRPPTCTITGLSEGHRHQVNGKACLANGLCSTTASFTAETLPAAPSSLYAEQITEFSFTVVTKAPPGEVSISHYEVAISGEGVTHSCRIQSSPALHCNVTELLPMTKYTLTAKACSTVGCGPTLKATAFTLPVQSHGVSTRSATTTTSIEVGVTPAVTTSKIITYKIRGDGLKCDAKAGPAIPSCELTGLVPGKWYSVRAASCGENEQCSRETLGMVNTLPEAPRNFSVEFINSTAVEVNIEGVEGNPDVFLYKAMVGCGSSGKVCRVMRETMPLRCQLVGLRPETPYTISVRSCLMGDICGEPLKKKLRVKPKRRCSPNRLIKSS